MGGKGVNWGKVSLKKKTAEMEIAYSKDDLPEIGSYADFIRWFNLHFRKFGKDEARQEQYEAYKKSIISILDYWRGTYFTNLPRDNRKDLCKQISWVYNTLAVHYTEYFDEELKYRINKFVKINEYYFRTKEDI